MKDNYLLIACYSSLTQLAYMDIDRKVLTLDEYTIQQVRQIPNATGELSALLRDIGLAAKRVNVEVNKAGLVDILGDAGSINVQGEDVKKLDVFANDQFTGVLRHGASAAPALQVKNSTIMWRLMIVVEQEL